jgi:hypothetical protein
MCECGDPACLETVEMTLAEYEALRADPELGVVAPGHESPRWEVFTRSEHFNLVLTRIAPVVERIPLGEPTDTPPAAA